MLALLLALACSNPRPSILDISVLDAHRSHVITEVTLESLQVNVIEPMEARCKKVELACDEGDLVSCSVQQTCEADLNDASAFAARLKEGAELTRAGEYHAFDHSLEWISPAVLKHVQEGHGAHAPDELRAAVSANGS